jgi:hypothetical protein
VETEKPVIQRFCEHIETIDLRGHTQPNALNLNISNSQAYSL